MKKIISCIIACFMPLTVSATEIVVPNMAPGHWVTTADMSAMLEKALASIPEASRAMAKEMMKKSMQPSIISEYCITKENLANYEEQVKSNFNGENNCKLDVTESTSEIFSATMNCSSMAIHITTKVINSKKNETIVISKTPDAGETKITTVSEWQSSVCPDGI